MIRHKAIGIGATLVGLAAGGNAMAAFTMDKDVDDTPFVLIAGPGFGGVETRLAKLGITNDGYVLGYDPDQGGHEIHILSSSLKKRNDVTGTANHSQYSLSQLWLNTQDLYNGSVPGNTKIANSTTFVSTGIARSLPDNTILSWKGNASPTIYQSQFQQSDGSYGIQQATRSTFTVAPIAIQYQSPTGVALGEGQYRVDLDYVATVGGNTFQMVGDFTTVNSSGLQNIDQSKGILKMEWSRGAAGTSTSPGTLNATASGTARFLVDGSNSKSNLLTNLVPSIADDIRGMAIDPVLHAGKSRLYFVSITGTSNDVNNVDPNPDYVFSDNKIYLSAVEFDFGDLTANSVATYVDLDPNSSNNHLEIQWSKPGYTDSQYSYRGNLLTARDLVFSPDGSKLYVSNDYDRVFMFTVPEPSSMGLLGVGALAFLRRKRENIAARSRLA